MSKARDMLTVTTGTTKTTKVEHAKHQPHSHAGILTSDYAETNFILAKQPLGRMHCTRCWQITIQSSSGICSPHVVHSTRSVLDWFGVYKDMHASILDPSGSGHPWKEPTLVAVTWPRWLSHSRRLYPSHSPTILISLICLIHRDSRTGNAINYSFAEPR